jgi:hypothetical protein
MGGRGNILSWHGSEQGHHLPPAPCKNKNPSTPVLAVRTLSSTIDKLIKHANSVSNVTNSNENHVRFC